MFDELRDLYQEVILDHGKHPRNFGDLEGYNHVAHGHNPMCGDTLVVYVKLDGNDAIEGVSFKGKGCAISVASASLMTEILKGRSKADAERLFHTFHKLCTEDEPPSVGEEDEEALERLEVLAGVREFPVRVKCATLAWHTLNAAMKGEEEISTE